jgi:hypothetical protein
VIYEYAACFRPGNEPNGCAAPRLRTITIRPVTDPSGDSPGPFAHGDVIVRYRVVGERQDASRTQG